MNFESVFVPVPCCFVIIALLYNLKSGIVISPALLFLFRVALDIQGHLCFHVNFRVDFSVSVKSNIGTLILSISYD
jgi:hypothetical protein